MPFVLLHTPNEADSSCLASLARRNDKGVWIWELDHGPESADGANHSQERRARVPALHASLYSVGSSRVDLQACKLEYSIVSPK